MRNFHVPLPDSLYESLRKEARMLDRPATALAREAIRTWVRERQREATARAIADYAGAMAGGPDDLDGDLEEAGLEVLTGDGMR